MFGAQKEKIYTVTDALRLVNYNIENISIVVEGELSKAPKVYNRAVYFSIKDEESVLDCVMWRNNFQMLPFEMKEGQKYRLGGNFSVYLKNGSMKFYPKYAEPAGEGVLRLQVAALKKRLEQEGLMRKDHKKPLPVFPERVGLVTSGNGSAVHDVLRTLKKRFPLAKILFSGVRVEGKGAVESIINGIDALEDQKPEVILLVRGGGSFEDLMPFNDEKLARRIYRCSIPVVTGIGHEDDNSIADLVSDMRASTPTAAAEAISPDPEFIATFFDRYFNRLQNTYNSYLTQMNMSVAHMSKHRYFTNPRLIYQEIEGSVRAFEERLKSGLVHATDPLGVKHDQYIRIFSHIMQQDLLKRNQSLEIVHNRLNDLAPSRIIDRGFSVVKDNEGRIIKSVKDIKTGDTLSITVRDGALESVVSSITQKIEKEDNHDSK